MRRIVGGLSIVAFAGDAVQSPAGTQTARLDGVCALAGVKHRGIRVEQPPDGDWLPWLFPRVATGRSGDPWRWHRSVDGVVVMTYVPASLPFQIKTEFRPQ